MRVPKPTSRPAAATQPSGRLSRAITGPAKPCHARPAASSPAMNQARQGTSVAASGVTKPCRMPLTPAILPLAASSQTLAAPIMAPPMRAEMGVKSCI